MEDTEQIFNGQALPRHVSDDCMEIINFRRLMFEVEEELNPLLMVSSEGHMGINDFESDDGCSDEITDESMRMMFDPNLSEVLVPKSPASYIGNAFLTPAARHRIIDTSFGSVDCILEGIASSLKELDDEMSFEGGEKVGIYKLVAVKTVRKGITLE